VAYQFHSLAMSTMTVLYDKNISERLYNRLEWP